MSTNPVDPTVESGAMTQGGKPHEAVVDDAEASSSGNEDPSDWRHAQRRAVSLKNFWQEWSTRRAASDRQLAVLNTALVLLLGFLLAGGYSTPAAFSQKTQTPSAFNQTLQSPSNGSILAFHIFVFFKSFGILSSLMGILTSIWLTLQTTMQNDVTKAIDTYVAYTKNTNKHLFGTSDKPDDNSVSISYQAGIINNIEKCCQGQIMKKRVQLAMTQDLTTVTSEGWGRKSVDYEALYILVKQFFDVCLRYETDLFERAIAVVKSLFLISAAAAIVANSSTLFVVIGLAQIKFKIWGCGIVGVLVVLEFVCVCWYLRHYRKDRIVSGSTFALTWLGKVKPQ